MAASLGSLVVSLGLNAGEYTQGLTKAQRDAKQFADDLNRTFKEVGAALGGYLSVHAFTEFIKGTIDAADHLNDLSKKTGIAVETLGGIGFAAKQAGGDIETATAAAGKLNKQLAEAASGNLKANEAFKALGISVKDVAGNTKTADQAIAEIADKFATYTDGPEKAALALRLFGKAGADMIPLLDEGGAKLRENIAYFQRFSGVTAETAKKADEFNDTMVKLKLLNGAFGQSLITELLGPLQNIADAFVNLKEKSTFFQTAAEGVASVFKVLVEIGANVAYVFIGVGREIAAVTAQIVALAHFDLKGFHAIGDAVKADGVDAKKQLEAFIATLNGTAAAAEYSNEGRNSRGSKRAAPRIPDQGGADSANAELKKQLDGQIKLIQAWALQRQDALDFANKLLDSEYQDGLVTLQNVQADEANIRARSLQVQIEAQDKIIAAERAFARRTSSATDRIDAENKNAEAVEKKTQAIVKAGQTEQLTNRANAREVLALQDRYNDLRATILKQSGDDAGAAQIRIAQQIREAGRLVAQQGGDPKLVEQYAAQLQGIQRLTQAQTEYTRLLDRAGNAEAQLLLDAEAAGKGELDTLAAVRDSRKATLAQLGELAEAARRLADELKTPDAIKFADDLALAFKRAKAEVDPLAKKFNDLITNDFENAFTGFLDGTKTAKQAFRDFANSVLADIARISARQFAQDLFGVGGASGAGGIGAFFSGLFGSSGGGDTGVALGSLSGLAVGGPAVAGKTYMVGENGPELLRMGAQSGAVIPSGQWKSGGDTHVHVTVQGAPNQSRDSALQQGAAIGLGIQVAIRRNT